MKTIEEQFQEWLRAELSNHPDEYPQPVSEVVTRKMRRAFFAGFNRSYCIVNDEPHNITINEYEREMDEYSTARDEGRA